LPLDVTADDPRISLLLSELSWEGGALKLFWSPEDARSAWSASAFLGCVVELADVRWVPRLPLDLLRDEPEKCVRAEAIRLGEGRKSGLSALAAFFCILFILMAFALSAMAVLASVPSDGIAEPAMVGVAGRR
jgi:hypothetical protein